MVSNDDVKHEFNCINAINSVPCITLIIPPWTWLITICRDTLATLGSELINSPYDNLFACWNVSRWVKWLSLETCRALAIFSCQATKATVPCSGLNLRKNENYSAQFSFSCAHEEPTSVDLTPESTKSWLFSDNPKHKGPHDKATDAYFCDERIVSMSLKRLFNRKQIQRDPIATKREWEGQNVGQQTWNILKLRASCLRLIRTLFSTRVWGEIVETIN